MSVREIIRANNVKWNAAFNGGDAAAVAALYTADATVLPHTHDVVTGAVAIREFWKSVIDAAFRNHSIEVIDIRSSLSHRWLTSLFSGSAWGGSLRPRGLLSHAPTARDSR